MSDWGVLFLLFLIMMIILALTNILVMKISGKNKKKRIWSGIICILITPVVFFLTGLSVSPLDPYGFGTGVLMIIYGAFFALNGVGIVVTGLFLESENR
ncbi:hypothetical protein [Rossellomorea vietnamensis]|uniref:Uncharacterized protein n=1 Tax=Rossellomorea vietnamensis TaxID=218284 RepID=A0ACD4C9N6_9BACI|nr:hypothetical protein [Rossellomorea vietnamensis]UXH45202.1 hypothetical protein N5C46_03820 [Rossellomorea vietnamensis]WQI96558.1 hypothetical protein Q7C14_03925 [Rossellomorea vietnamensis]